MNLEPILQVFDYFMARDLMVLRGLPASGESRASSINFWDLGNAYATAARFAADIKLADLQDPDFSPHSMGVSKRAATFM
jgi:hypothetical protein